MTKVLLMIFCLLLLVCGQTPSFGGEKRPPASSDRSDVRLLAMYALDERFIHLEEPSFAKGKATVRSRVGNERCVVTLVRVSPPKGESYSGWRVEKIVCGMAVSKTAAH
jgi:hypothetical protein